MPDNSLGFKRHLNSGQFVRYSNGGLNNGPFNNRTDPHGLNTGLVRYSDPHCKCFRLNVAFQRLFNRDRASFVTEPIKVLQDVCQEVESG